MTKTTKKVFIYNRRDEAEDWQAYASSKDDFVYFIPEDWNLIYEDVEHISSLCYNTTEIFEHSGLFVVIRQHFVDDGFGFIGDYPQVKGFNALAPLRRYLG